MDNIYTSQDAKTLRTALAETHDLINPIECIGGEELLIVFYHDVEDSERICPGEPEPVTFVSFLCEPETKQIRTVWRSPERGAWSAEINPTFEWEAYIFEGDWAYGSSAERFDIWRKR